MVGAPRTTHLTGAAGTHDATPPRMGMRGEANSSRKAVLRCGQRKRKHDAFSTHLLHLGGLCVNLVTYWFNGAQSASGTQNWVRSRIFGGKRAQNGNWNEVHSRSSLSLDLCESFSGHAFAPMLASLCASPPALSKRSGASLP